MSEWVGIHCHSLQFARTSYIVFQSMMLFVVRQRNGIMAIFSYEPKPQRGHDGFQTKKCLVNSEDITKTRRKNTRRRQKITKKNNTCKDTQCIWRGGAVPSPQKMTQKKHKCKDAQCIFRRTLQKETTNAKTPDASGGRRLSLTHHEENKRE